MAEGTSMGNHGAFHKWEEQEGNAMSLSSWCDNTIGAATVLLFRWIRNPNPNPNPRKKSRCRGHGISYLSTTMPLLGNVDGKIPRGRLEHTKSLQAAHATIE